MMALGLLHVGRRLLFLKVKKQLSECVEELIYLRRSNNSTYALACTLRGSGQGVMPYVGDKLAKLSVEGYM